MYVISLYVFSRLVFLSLLPHYEHLHSAQYLSVLCQYPTQWKPSSSLNEKHAVQTTKDNSWKQLIKQLDGVMDDTELNKPPSVSRVTNL